MLVRLSCFMALWYHSAAPKWQDWGTCCWGGAHLCIRMGEIISRYGKPRGLRKFDSYQLFSRRVLVKTRSEHWVHEIILSQVDNVRATSYCKGWWSIYWFPWKGATHISPVGFDEYINVEVLIPQTTQEQTELRKVHIHRLLLNLELLSFFLLSTEDTKSSVSE